MENLTVRLFQHHLHMLCPSLIFLLLDGFSIFTAFDLPGQSSQWQGTLPAVTIDGVEYPPSNFMVRKAQEGSTSSSLSPSSFALGGSFCSESHWSNSTGCAVSIPGDPVIL